MNGYRLIVVTHGAGPTLDRVLASFDENVTPEPAEKILIVDGPGRIPDDLDGDWVVWGSVQQKGFCITYDRVWRAARETELDYVFLLENDFVFARPVDVAAIADVISRHPKLAQIALVRQAVNETEKAAGGLIESRPGQFTQILDHSIDGTVHEWLRHRAFFTSNPCVFPSRLAHDQPWPEVAEFCEGVYGIQLREAGYDFGFWGDGSVWVEHLGVRDGFGY